jgi:thioesterase domain-containing protein
VFAVPGHNGDVFCYREFARRLGDDQPIFGLEPPGLDGRSAPLTRIEDIAAYFADQIVAFRPHGPCIIAGYCAGGTVAFELGRQLTQAGRDVRFVALLGSPYPTWYRYSAQVPYQFRRQCERVFRRTRALWSLPAGVRLRQVTESLRRLRARREAGPAASLDPVLAKRREVERATLAAVRRYTPRHFAGRVALLVPDKDWLPAAVSLWRSIAGSSSEYYGPSGCQGETMLLEHAPAFAGLFRQCRDAHEESWTAPSSLRPDRRPAATLTRWTKRGVRAISSP